jgi:hypothetical protein
LRKKRKNFYKLWFSQRKIFLYKNIKKSPHQILAEAFPKIFQLKLYLVEKTGSIFDTAHYGPFSPVGVQIFLWMSLFCIKWTGPS